MQRILSLAMVLWAVGCGIENDFGYDPPDYPNADPLPPEKVSQTDTIIQVTTPKVDILWTIDNSCSMYDEQTALAENFPIFMEYFTGSGLDYHVGVVSTAMDNPSHSGKLRTAGGAKYITKETPNPVGIFATMAQMGTSGSATERGLGATYTALEIERDRYNAGFYRDEASVHTICISDEPDQTQSWLITQGEFIDWYKGLKRDRDDRTFSSIVMPAPTGSSYLNVTAEVGGIPYDINDPEWDVVLTRLGVQTSGLKTEYFLSQQPVEESIQVEVHEDLDDDVLVQAFDRAIVDEYGTVLEGDWTYNSARNSIEFVEFVPKALNRVVITYDLLAATQEQ